MSTLLDSTLASPLDQPVREVKRATRHTARRLHATQAILIAIAASGMLWDNVLFFRVLDYPVTLVTIVTAILFVFGLANWVRKRRTKSALLVPALVLLLYELVLHGILGGDIGNIEWIRSYSLLTMCVGLLIVLSNFRIRPQQLPAIAKAISYMAYCTGGLGIIQFILANTFGFAWRPLPDWLAVGQANVESDALRFAGLQRALGISSEFSYYGIGMTVLAAICLALLYLVPFAPKERLFRYGALITSLGGIIASVSFTAWGLLAIVLLGWVASKNVIVVVRRRKVFLSSFVVRRRRVLLASFLVLFGFVAFLWPYVQDRWTSIIMSTDGSTNYRVKASIDLIVSPSDDPSLLLLGTGVGLDGQNPRVQETFLKYFSQDYLNWINSSSVLLTNGYSYVAITMGWIGLALHVWLIAAVFYKRGNRLVPRLPFILLLIGYPFTNGLYLSPSWWACFVLITALLSLHVEEHLTVRSAAPQPFKGYSTTTRT